MLAEQSIASSIILLSDRIADRSTQRSSFFLNFHMI